MPAGIINLNDSIPAAPIGYVNVSWQKGPQAGTDPATGLPINPVSAYVLLGGGLTAIQEVPAGVGTSTLTLSFVPVDASVMLVVNGVVQMPGVDYTALADVLSMTVSTESDDKLGVWYVKR